MLITALAFNDKYGVLQSCIKYYKNTINVCFMRMIWKRESILLTFLVFWLTASMDEYAIQIYRCRIVKSSQFCLLFPVETVTKHEREELVICLSKRYFRNNKRNQFCFTNFVFGQDKQLIWPFENFILIEMIKL